MNPEEPENYSLEEFEQEFSPENDHPLQVLGSWIVVLGCGIVLLFWIMLLMETLRH